jgi:hypothetical protein
MVGRCGRPSWIRVEPWVGVKCDREEGGTKCEVERKKDCNEDGRGSTRANKLPIILCPSTPSVKLNALFSSHQTHLSHRCRTTPRTAMLLLY